MAIERHVVMFSGGIGSWACAQRVAKQHGTDNLTLLFADVGGDHAEPHAGEDEDTYRFVTEAAANIGGTLVTLNQGETIFDVFIRRRFLGNSRQANCSIELKQKPCRRYLDEHHPDAAHTTVYVGVDWTEVHRLPAIEKAYLPYRALAPMTEPPYLDKNAMLAAARDVGLAPPRMYAQGYPHGNCGGGCVRAGQAQFEKLLRVNPDRYRYWEAQEAKIREHLDADVTILRYKRGGTSIPLTLKTFREEQESQPGLFDADDFGGCGCFTQEPS